MTRVLGVLTLTLVLAVSAAAQNASKFNKKIAVGDAAPTFTGLPGVDDKSYALSDFQQDVLVVCITCNHCPVAQAYEGRLIDFAKKYAAGPNAKVGLVAINVNNGEDDKLPTMRERAKEKGFNFPYLHDASQRIGRQFGATVTPEFFVLNKDRKIVYMGAMDDANSTKYVKTNYLVPAVEAALKGTSPAITETRARGCGVQYERTAGN